MNLKIPFNKPYITGLEFECIIEAYRNCKLSGDGVFTKKCSTWLETITKTKKALLTHSCTAALEMAAILIDIQPGDEVIMPSYTFVSTANAFVLRGGIPVFIDIRPDTLNIDESKIENAITKKTKAIIPVHYAGVGCEMDTIMAIAKKYNLYVIEDAAQGMMSKYKGRALGSIGHLGTYSFHETKNISCGEGGALLLNDPVFIDRAEIIREKGTNRTKFFRGEVDKYSWIDIGSSFLPGELCAAFLWAQMNEAEEITKRRLNIWDKYQRAFCKSENESLVKCPIIPKNTEHNAHMYYLVLKNALHRNKFISFAKEKNIDVTFHYVPLHSSPAGRHYGRQHGELKITEELSSCVIRLPVWLGIENHLSEIINELSQILAALDDLKFKNIAGI